MLSLTCKTAIKAVIYLSSKSENGEKSNIKDISDRINASEHTVGKILQQLARKKIINSLKGPTGGFYLDEKQQEQAIIHIVEAIEGDHIFKECGLGLRKCSAAHPCPIHDEYKIARELIEKMFNKQKVRDLCQSVTKGLAYLID
ncbi:Rrf2 family transcriptional regulator [Sphingobacterium sp. DN00404]|uniref:Rrf2 family transcriptional regulator n=1 Tax=Sphingobacterium micropteri TaxID=2763501 RepID=A0ABR7YJP0_9SPHI|nr:Rrf2 family transcriptional regulator [Sphingobacterium micropteri]MBD1431466.1 Rrf2 family transcriptional regulator [Sphingobacterium micropteri]